MLIKLIVLGMMKYLIEVKLILEHEAAFDGLTQPYINMIMRRKPRWIARATEYIILTLM